VAKPPPRTDRRKELLAKGADQFAICTRHCGARCCRYVTVSIPTPVAEDDWDEMRWWLAHEGVTVSKESDGWMVVFETRCRNLGEAGECRAYRDRMRMCSEHDVTDCEFALDVESEVELKSESDLADYLERRRLVRGRKVARAIRRAERARRKAAAAAPSPLVQITPLGPPG
jgi:hypothetical protein